MHAETRIAPPLFDLRGQRVLATGAASGRGLAMAPAVLEAGARRTCCIHRPRPPQTMVNPPETPMV